LTIKTVTKDHVLPLAQGGTDNKSNIRPACKVCNNLKGALTLEQFKEVAKQAWKDRLKSKSWQHLFSRFGEVGVMFYYEGETYGN
jgi:5-methylcytosine-specific restriction endonuclease McrA